MSKIETFRPRPAPGFTSGYLDAIALIERLHRLLLDLIKDEFERTGMIEINPVQGLLLFNVGDAEVTAGELKTRGYYQGSNVSYNLKKLVELGYMHHQRCSIDRRAVRVKLTPKGHEVRDLLSELFDRHAETARTTQVLTDGGQLELVDALRRIERFWGDQIRYIY
jgi:DNA-binding MarR family transcriptional regulator